MKTLKTFCLLLPLLLGLVGCEHNIGSNTNTTKDIVSVQHELADLIDQMNHRERFDELSTTLAAIQQQQDALDSQLSQIAASLRKSTEAKFVTKNDLADAIEVTKEAISNAKTGSMDCDCMAKLSQLEKRIDDLEAKCNTQALAYSTKSSGCTGTVSSSNYTAQSVTYGQPVVTNYSVSGGSNGSFVSNPQYSAPQYSVQTTAIDVPDQTRTVKVVEPRSRRQVTFAEVPEHADVGLAVQSTQQCYTDANGNRVCPSSTATTTRPAVGSRLGSRLFGR